MVLTPFLILFCLLFESISPKCHYSCETCAYSYHQSCIKCSNQNSLLIVKDPTQVQKQYRDSLYQTGICTNGSQFQVPNPLGIIILVSFFILVPVTKNKFIFNIVSTLQSISLIGFLEYGWLIPLGFILNALQYLSPCNIMTVNSKTESIAFQRYSFYYIGQQYVQPELIRTFAFVGILNIICIFFIILLQILKTVKLKFYTNQCKDLFCLSTMAFDYLLNYFKALYFLLIQESVLAIVVALNFSTINTFTIVVISIYGAVTIIFIIYVMKVKISLMSNRLVQIYAILKKIVYPIFIVVPFQYQFFLIVFMGINCIIQGIFDYSIDVYPLKSRNTLFKIFQLLTILFFGIFILCDSVSSSSSAPLAFNWITTVFVCSLILFFYVETGLLIKQKINRQNNPLSIKVFDSNQIKNISQDQTKRYLPELSTNNRGVPTGLMNSRRNETQANIFSNENGAGREVVREEMIEDDVNVDDVEEPAKADRPEVQDNQNVNNIQDANKKVDGDNQNETKNKKQEKGKKNRSQKNNDLRKQLKKRYGI